MRSFLIIFSILFYTPAFCQQVAGNWEGALQIQGTEIPIVFHINKDSAGKYSATFDSPLQNAFNLPCSDVIVKADSVILLMKMINGKYSGQLNATKNSLSGEWSQSGQSFPLIMKKTGDAATRATPKRPQTPTPPFPYKSEDVEYANADRSVHFGGTFTVPLPDPNVNYFRAPIYPVVILITGSGPQDRDETILGHKPFAVIADYLTRQGIAVLRVDDRGIGKTTGNFNNSTTADFAKDVEAGITYLTTRNDVDLNSIGLLGHSEGALIAPMVASQTKKVAFIILLAGPGIKIVDLMEQQNADVMLSSGIAKTDVNLYRPLYTKLATAIINTADSLEAAQEASRIFDKWQAKTPVSTVKNTTGIVTEKDKDEFINSFVKALSGKWFSYFMKMNPADHLSKINCPVLAINGEKDVQVAAKPNLSAIKNEFNKNNNNKVKTVEMRGLNHLFQHCKKCTVTEYGELEETFDLETLKLISEWIQNGRFNNNIPGN